jgi:hypothetical protein
MGALTARDLLAGPGIARFDGLLCAMGGCRDIVGPPIMTSPAPMRRDAALRELKRIAANLRRPLIADDLADEPRLLSALRIHFGSFPAARRAAGLPDPPSEHRWSLAGLLRELRRLHRAGARITREGLAAAGRRDLVAAAERLVGSVVKARDHAKLPGPSAFWTKERVLKELRARARAGEPLDAKLKGGARLSFGTVREAYAAAGLEPERRVWTRDELLRAVRAAGASALPRDLRHGCRGMFGSVAEARKAAGVRERQRQWTRADVLAELRRAGGVASSAALKKACHRHFGTVAAARRAAAIEEPREAWSRKRVVEELRSLGTRAIPRALLYACAKHFGSAAAARRAAGVVPAREKWSAEAVLAQVKRSGSGQLPPSIRSAARRHFGSVSAARRAAGMPTRRRV